MSDRRLVMICGGHMWRRRVVPAGQGSLRLMWRGDGCLGRGWVQLLHPHCFHRPRAAGLHHVYHFVILQQTRDSFNENTQTNPHNAQDALIKQHAINLRDVPIVQHPIIYVNACTNRNDWTIQLHLCNIDSAPSKQSNQNNRTNHLLACNIQSSPSTQTKYN